MKAPPRRADAGAAPSRLPTGRSARRGRLVAALLFALFFAPVLVSLWLNVVRPAWLPTSATNRGELVRPARLLAAAGADALTPDGVFDERWTLMLVSGARPGIASAVCPQSCAGTLETMRKTKLALGRENDRLRITLVMRSAVGRAAAAALGERYPGLQLVAATDAWLAQIPGLERTGADPGTTIYLVDPQRYLMMRYVGSVSATSILKDLKRLLRISKIG